MTAVSYLQIPIAVRTVGGSYRAGHDKCHTRASGVGVHLQSYLSCAELGRKYKIGTDASIGDIRRAGKGEAVILQIPRTQKIDI